MENQNPQNTNPFNQHQNSGSNNFNNQNYNYNNPGNFNQQIPVPNATGVLVLGIVSLATFWCYGVPGIICAIIALILAKKGNEEYQANPGMYSLSSYNNLKAGRICAIIGLAMGILMIIFVIVYIIFVVSLVNGVSRFPFG